MACWVCGEKCWPYAVAKPKDYVCIRCRGVSPEKREAAGQREVVGGEPPEGYFTTEGALPLGF